MPIPRFDRYRLAAVSPYHQPPGNPVSAIFSVDVEEYFQVSSFDKIVDPAEWPTLPSRIEAQIDVLLDLLAKHEAKGTFFVLGWIARHHPRVVRRIHDAGHEIASHGDYHLRVCACGAKRFREEIAISRDLLEDLIGERVLGYRAPSFSITPGTEWAFDILLEEGYVYDSSLFPIRRSGYGHPGADVRPFWIDRLAGSLLEIPPTTFRFAGMRLPAAGGAYLRHFPYSLTRHALEHSEVRMVYIHPWELDPDQPRLPVSWLTTKRHYGGVEGTRSKVERMLSEFPFQSIADVFALPTTAQPVSPVSASSV